MTGEENETILFKSMGKVFFFDPVAKRWKDRGRGQIKLNRTLPDENDTPSRTARFIMRTEGTYTLVLNSPVYKGMKFGELDGSAPTGQNLQFRGWDGKVLTTMLIKVR
jgi:Ran-binding protein 3